ncbi:uroporphyrinogen-III synthase [Chitinophaga lutea]
MQKSHRILSTKTLSAEQRLLAEERGIAVAERLFIDIKPVEGWEDDPSLRKLEFGHSGVYVFTSPNAVQALANARRADNWKRAEQFSYWRPSDDRRIYCLQGATLKAVNELLPNALVVDTAPNSVKLAEKIIAAGDIQQVTFCCGNIRRPDLPDMLRAAGIGVHEIVVYETTETPVVTEEHFDGVLFFSPSSVRSFFSVNTLPPDTACFAIGDTTGAALADVTDNKVIVSPQPSVDHLLQTVIFYFDNINCYE